MASKINEMLKYVTIGIQNRDPLVIGVLVGLLVVLLTIFLLGLISRKKKLGRGVIVAGVCESGKTSLFCRLVYGSNKTTYTSLKENSGLYQIHNTSKTLRLIDLPGHERVRMQAMDRHKGNARGIIYVIDSSTFQREIKEVAEFLYTILSDSTFYQHAPPVLIACNKQDLTLSKGASIVQTQLEKEINTLRVTRSAALQALDNTVNNVFLGKKNKPFQFEDLKSCSVEFVESSITDKGDDSELNDVINWLQKIA